MGIDIMKTYAIASAVILALSIYVEALTAAPIIIRFSHVVAENTPKGQGANLFKQRVEERLGDKVKVEVFPNAIKTDDDSVLFNVLLGDVQLAAPSLAKFSNFTKKIQVFDLPFLFQDVDAVDRFQNSEAGRQLLKAMEDKGLKGLAYWHNGMRVMSANKPLRNPDDLRGLIFRIEPSDVFEDQYRTLGAAIIKIPFSYVHEALKTGLVDGQENSWSNIYSQKFYEEQSYFTETKHSYQGYMVVTSTRFWNSLPTDVRSELEKILTEVTAEVNKIAREQAQSDRHKVIDSGVTQVIELTDQERDLWRQTMQPIWKQFENEIGKDVIDAALKANRSAAR